MIKKNRFSVLEGYPVKIYKIDYIKVMNICIIYNLQNKLFLKNKGTFQGKSILKDVVL